MLVLSRKQGQSLTLGDSISITVIEIVGDKIKLGIEAPRSLPILRDELIRPETVTLPFPTRPEQRKAA